MEIDLDDLEAKCRAATPGPWFVLHGDDECFMCTTAIASKKTREGNDGQFNDDEQLVAITFRQRYPFVAMDDDDCGEANSVYMAAANPAVTLELIAQLRKAREERDELLAALISLAAVARRYLPDYDENPEVQKADAAIVKAEG